MNNEQPNKPAIVNEASPTEQAFWLAWDLRDIGEAVMGREVEWDLEQFVKRINKLIEKHAHE